jgi:hypothetical protein
MRRLLGWIFDGAVLGAAMGGIFACCVVLAIGPWGEPVLPAQLPVFLAMALSYTGGIWALWTALGALQGALLCASFGLRRVLPAELAPALFSWVGLLTGLAAAVDWLGRWARWGQCGCSCSPTSLEPEQLWLAVIGTLSVGSMVVLPVFAVTRGSGRGRALLAACLVAWLVLPPLGIAGALVTDLDLLEVPALLQP